MGVVVRRYIPYSGKFSPGKNFAKAGSVVLREHFARFIFAHTRRGEIKFQGIMLINFSLTLSVLNLANRAARGGKREVWRRSVAFVATTCTVIFGKPSLVKN